MFKKHIEVSDAHRVAMCRAAIEDNPAFDVSTLEVDRAGDTYTVDTLKTLRAHYPENVELYFIAGADAILTLPQWRDAPHLARLASFVGLNRPRSATLRSFRKNGEKARWHCIRTLFVEAPLQALRDFVSVFLGNRSVRYLIPPAVWSILNLFELIDAWLLLNLFL